ncbi:MAG TPA: hypothetical protein VHG70_16140 [Nocardioidaceae bacterium]|nr:hypothetical protein [Nocardioidaceae bacterium]
MVDVADRQRVAVRAAPGDDHARDRRAQFVDRIDQHAFVVGLPAVEIEAELTGRTAAQFLDVTERRGAIRGGVPLAEEVEVWGR